MNAERLALLRWYLGSCYCQELFAEIDRLREMVFRCEHCGGINTREPGELFCSKCGRVSEKEAEL